MTLEDPTPVIPGAGQCSIQARHLPEMLNHAARPHQRYDRATLASAVNKPREQAEPSGIDVVDARQIERDGCGLVDVRRPEVLVCTVAENQPAACPYDDALCLAGRRQRELTHFG
jgi:hypothetical protein